MNTAEYIFLTKVKASLTKNTDAPFHGRHSVTPLQENAGVSNESNGHETTCFAAILSNDFDTCTFYYTKAI